MEQVKNHKDLVSRLKSAIDNTDKKNIAIQAGHFPLRFDPTTRTVKEDLDVWGEFSRYTLEIGAQLAKYSQEKGKDVKLFFVCDDHSYAGEYEDLRKNDNGLSQWRKLRGDFYKKISNDLSLIHPEYSEILKHKGLDFSIIKTHNQGKFGRENSPYFSETILRSNDDSDGVQACSREYISLIDEHLDEKDTYLIGFVPKRCLHSIHDALWIFRPKIKSSHVFINTGFDSKPKNMRQQYKGDEVIVYQQ